MIKGVMNNKFHKNLLSFLLLMISSYSIFAETPPDPTTLAPYRYTQWNYSINVKDEWHNVEAFAPRVNNGILRNRPLVIILHGNGYSSKYSSENYLELSRHLARNGFFVIKPDWKSNIYAAAESNISHYDSAKHSLIRNLEHVYQNYNQYLSDNVVLIGHSVGGAAVVRYANQVGLNTPEGRLLRVKSIIAMAASSKKKDIEDTFSLYNIADSLLVMEATGDRDTWGKKYFWGGINNGVMRTGFKLYDAAGTQNTIYYPFASLYPHKDLLYFHQDNLNQQNGGFKHSHFAQGLNAKYVNAYITAYLYLHVYDDQRFNHFFKYQQRPAFLPEDISVLQSHSEQEKKVVATFQNKDLFYFFGGGSYYPAGTITTDNNWGELNTSIGESWIWDNFSPHKDSAFNITWDRWWLGDSARLLLTYFYHDRPNLNGYKYLSFRVAQRSPGVNMFDYYNPNGEDLDFSIRLFNGDNNHSNAVYLSEHNQKVSYPVTAAFFVSDGFIQDVTKHAMQTVIIPLSAFIESDGSQLDLSSLQQIKFYFYGKGRITLDNIEFIK